mgnify:FL=1
MTCYEEILKMTREREPLVQCITNFVTVNDCANIILAAGGTPAMSHVKEEAAEAVQKAGALVCNMGAIEDAQAMILAGKEANRLGIPVILDPVAAGGTSLRRATAKQLLEEVHFAVIRGNASEIRSLAGEKVTGRGVDVSALDAVTEEKLPEAVKTVELLARRLKSVIAVSGKTDIVSDGDRTVLIRNGCATMSRITGSGCMVTSLIGAFCGAAPKRPFEAAAAGLAVMGIAGETAESLRLSKGTGNATFRNDLIDAVFNFTENQLTEEIKIEVYRE